MSTLFRLFAVILFAFITSCSSQPKKTFPGSTETEKFNNFLDYSYNTFLERSPMELAYRGIEKRTSELDDFTEKYAQEEMGLAIDHLNLLKSFDKDDLDDEAKLSYELYKKELMDKVEDWKWRDYTYAVNQMFGIQSQLPTFMMNIHQVKSEKDLKDYITRLSSFKRVMGEVVTGLMKSETKGVVPPQFVFEKVISDSQNIITGQPFDSSKKDSPLWSDFKNKAAELKLDKKSEEALLNDAKSSLVSSVGPAYQSLIHFLKLQEKRATKDDGIWKFPKGEEFYQYRLKKMTTTSLSAEEIHQIGLQNVARIHKEMTAIKNKVGFKGDLQSFFKHVGSEKYLYPNTPIGKKSYLNKAKNYIDEMRKSLSQFFITLPNAPIEVRAVEAFREKSAGMAFYQSPSPDGARPGRYYVNLYNMKALPKWEAEALAYHEGIPGHHMQISIAQELKALPEFRRFMHVTAFIEGWGLYSEKFPKEFGFYKDPYSDFGRLSMELVRACRLVVDTGIHQKKWTREQAIAYLDKNTPGDHEDNVRQINRYIVMPGQATAYMVGMLKILELKEKAKSELKEKFDIKQFHEVVLTSGAVPLTTLENLVEKYINKTKTN